MASISGLSRHHLRGSSQRVVPADILVVNPDAVHTTVAEKDSRWQFVTAHLPLALFNHFREENGAYGSRTLAFSDRVLRQTQIHHQLISLHEAKVENGSPLYQDHCLQELLCELWAISREPLRLPHAPGLSLNISRDYLHEHFQAKVRVKELAVLAGVSEFHFCRQFLRQFGISPHAYQVQLRLLAAKRMLRSGSSINKTARDVGFSSQSHLTRMFLRVNGMTPAHFQKNSKIVQGDVQI